MRISTLILFVTACGGTPADTVAPDSPGASGSTAAPVTDTGESGSLPLRRGRYEATQFTFENDTCGELVQAIGLYASDADIVWDGPDAFLVDYAEGGTETPCTVVADGSVACGGYDQLWGGSGGDADLWVESETTSFEVISAEAFEQVESLRFFCEGPQCDTVEYGWEWEPPCTVDLRAVYERR